ncbi:MAG: tRNA/rRNA methyltransferase [bacterium]
MEYYFILVEPSVPENIGAAASAIKTMGFSNLRLVNPPGYPQEKMFHVAHASHDILNSIKIFDDLENAIADLDFTIATSAKHRSIRNDYHHAAIIPQILEKKSRSVSKTGIIFGREESGLDNEEIRLCDIVSFIPMKKKYPSLNLSQAVMLYAYLLSEHTIVRKKQARSVGKEKFRQVILKADNMIEKISIMKGSNIYNRIFERLALLGDDDLNLVLSILAKFDKFIDARGKKKD